MLKKISTLTVFAAVIAFVAAFTVQPVIAFAEGAPKIVVSPEKYDFGQVEEGASPKAVFTIKNEGDAQLMISDVKPSCGCTLAKLAKKILEPGEATTLEATYNSKGRHGGKITKTVTIRSNDPAAQSKVVYITGNVKELPAPVLTLNAAGITQLKMKKGEVEHRVVKLGNIGQLDLNIQEITAPPSIKITIGDNVIDPGKTMLVDITIKPGEVRNMDLVIAPVDAKPGRFMERITLRSNNKGRSVTPLAVGGTIE